MEHTFEFCVFGAGSAGFAAATTARGLGKSVAFVDGTEPLGGLCILRGCMPSKTVLRSAEIAHLAQRGPNVGVMVAGVRPDVKAVIERKRRIIKDFADFRVQGIDTFPVFRGAPRFVGPRAIAVGDDVINAEKFLISTGSIINVPEIPGLRETGFITSDDVLEMERLPAEIITLGGGPVACELAQYLYRMGSRVTIVQRSNTLLSHEDADLGEALGKALVADGIEVMTGAVVTSVARKGTKKRVIARRGGATVEWEADEIFLALGRRPNVDGFGFEAAGIEFSPQGVQVDAYLQTANQAIFAAGDVTGKEELVHVAVYEGQLAARNAFAKTMEAAHYELQGARAVFTDPQVAIAGLSERECVERGIEHAVARYPFDDHGKAIAADLTAGHVKMIASPDGTILGVGIVGAEASDLIHEAIVLLYFKANVCDVLAMPHLHPTLAEIMTYPAEELSERLEHEWHPLVRP